MARYQYVHPVTKEPFQVVANNDIPESVVRAWVGANLPSPKRSPLEPAPILSMPTPPEYDRGVWQSPKGPTGPGALANWAASFANRLNESGTFGSAAPGVGRATPERMHTEINEILRPTAEIAALPFLPAGATSTALRRILTGGALHGLTGTTEGKGTEGALSGAALQTGMEGLGMIGRMIAVSKLAKPIQAAYERLVEKLKLLNEQAAEGMARNAAGKDLVRAMDKGNIAAEGEALLGEHAKRIATVEAENAAKQKAREQMVRAQKQAFKDAVEQWKREMQALDAQHAVAMQQHAQQGAKVIMDEAKAVVPAWQVLPSDATGLIRAVKEDGQQLLSDAYAPAMKAAQEAARGIPILIPGADAKKLGLRPLEMSKGPTRLPSGTPPVSEVEGVAVDGSQLIGALTGMKGTNRDWGLYRRGVDALNAEELGIDPAARNAYKYGQGIIDSVAHSNMIVQGADKRIALDPDAFVQWALKGENIDTLRNRGMGGVISNPGFNAMLGSPPAVTPLPKPVAPLAPPKAELTPLPEKPALPEMPVRGAEVNPKPQDIANEIPIPEAPDFGAIHLPGTPYARGAALGGVGGLLGSLLGGLFGAHHGGGYGAAGGLIGGAFPGYQLGKGVGQMLPNEIKTTVPIQGFEELLRALMVGGGAALRAYDPSASAVSAADLAEIEAAKMAQRPDLSLQLGLDPSETR